MDRSRSPCKRLVESSGECGEDSPRLTLFGPSDEGPVPTLEALMRIHSSAPEEGAAPGPVLSAGAVEPQGTVPSCALCDWRISDEAIRDDALFRLADKVGYRDVLYGLHKTDRCDRCVFKEDTHEYFVDGRRAPWSGTTFSHYCERHFDAKAVAARMARIPGWAEKKGLVRADGRPFDAVEIERHWQGNGVSQSRRGTLMHWHVECHLNGYRIEEPLSPEFRLFLFFEREFLRRLGLAPWRTEMNLFHCGLRLAGQADLVCVDGRGRLVVLDWKRSREIKSGSRDGPMHPPLQHLPSCNRYTYYLQLNTYRHMLESEYLLPVSGMYVVVLHPEQRPFGPHVYVVPRMEAEVTALAAHIAQAKGFCADPRSGPLAPFEVPDGLRF